jgi:hypothetical protein
MTETTKYYSKEKHNLKPVVDGARMWGVALEKTLLTYFEIEPHSGARGIHQRDPGQGGGCLVTGHGEV